MDRHHPRLVETDFPVSRNKHMKRLTRRSPRLYIRVTGRKDGKSILNTLTHIPRVAANKIIASRAVELKIKVLYGRAKTNSGKIEDIVNEAEGSKKEILSTLKIFTSASELDAMEKYWEFV